MKLDAAAERGLDLKIYKLIRERGWGSLNNLQLKSFEAIGQGCNVLISAPTGYGKTEAALLPVINNLIKNNDKEKNLVYITPMKALINDIAQRVSWWSDRLGLNVARKHGDVPASEKHRRLRKKPDILIITPESLEIDLDWSSRFRPFYRNTGWIIIDEVHEIAFTKRGFQLALLIERIRKQFGADPQIIMLSATIGNPYDIAKLFSGSSKRGVCIINPSYYKSMSVTIDYIDLFSGGSRWEDIAKKIVSEIEPITIVFSPSRHVAEILFRELEKLGVRDIAVHHSSISGERKEEIEKRLREGKLNAVITTRTLELGIDIGGVNKVILIGSPKSSYSLLQRIGRSGHKKDLLSKGHILTTSPLEVFESLAITLMGLRGFVESPKIPACPLDVLAREVVGIALSGHPINIKLIRQLFIDSGFCSLSHDEIKLLLNELVENGMLKKKDGTYRIGPTFYKIWRFSGGKERWWARGFTDFFTFIGDRESFQVRNGDIIVGELDSLFVYKHLRIGDTIRLGGESWRVVDINDYTGRLEVVKAGATVNTVPLWSGGSLASSGDAVRETISTLKNYCNNNLEIPGKVLLTDRAKEIMETVCREDGFFNHVGTDRLVVSEENGDILIIYPGGQRVNDALGYLFLYEAQVRSETSPYFKSSSYGLVLHPSLDLLDIIDSITSREVLEEHLKKAVARSPIFYPILREIQLSFGVIGKVSSESLLAEEAVKQTIEKHLDLDGLWNLIEGIKKGKITLTKVDKKRIPSFIIREIESRPPTKIWYKDLSYAIVNTLSSWAFTIEELSEILKVPQTTIESKLKEMRKDSFSERVFRFYDTETGEWRWGLVRDASKIALSEEFRESFTPQDPHQLFRVNIRGSNNSKYQSFVISYRQLEYNTEEIMAKIPFEEIFEMKIEPLSTGLIKSFSPYYYNFPKSLFPLLFANAVTLLQKMTDY
jgi:ATP-dependent Lhr-like helicase